MMNIRLLLLFLLIQNMVLGQSTTINYTYSSAQLLNPERGFYRYTDTRASAPFPLTLEALDFIRSAGRTIIFRYVILDTYLNGPIEESFLEAIENDFAVLRAGGIKVILRFAYTDVFTGDPPYNDAPELPLLLDHIDQLEPVLADNWDVILTLQNGFWGVWGENYYSDYYGSEEDAPLTEQNWADRKAISNRLLELVPDDRLLSFRYPVLKSTFFDLEIPGDSLTAAEAYAGSIISRIGYHNDCFLVAANDFTFYDTEAEKPYWETESRYTIMGGESCGDNPEFTNCDNALIDLENAHWTYLNDFFHPDVLDRWEQEGCLDEIIQRLGYRLYLEEGTFDTAVAVGGTFNFNLSLTNEGYASPVNIRSAFLVFQSPNNTFSFPIQEDIRTWYGGQTYNISADIVPPLTMTPGTYQLYLHLPDQAETLEENPLFAIQLANEGLWQAETGYNDLLMEVEVSPISTTSEVESHTACSFTLHQIKTGIWEIENAIESLNLRVYDPMGKLVQLREQVQHQIDLTALPSGIYLMQVMGRSGCSQTTKISWAE